MNHNQRARELAETLSPLRLAAEFKWARMHGDVERAKDLARAIAMATVKEARWRGR